MKTAFHSRGWKASGRTRGASLHDHSMAASFSSIELATSFPLLVDNIASDSNGKPDTANYPANGVEAHKEKPDYCTGHEPHNGNYGDTVSRASSCHSKIQGHLPFSFLSVLESQHDCGSINVHVSYQGPKVVNRGHEAEECRSR